MRCKLCGSERSVLLKTLTVKYALNSNPVSSDFSLVRCAGCKVMRAEPMFNRRALLGIYNEDYFRAYVNDTPERVDYFKGILNELNDLALKGKILDIGCGDGLFLSLAKEDGWEGCGIEPSACGAAIAKKKYGVDVYNGFPEETNFKKGTFDVITLFNVLGNTQDPVSCVRVAKELLAPGGLLIIETPNFGNIWFKYRAFENTLLGIDSLHLPTTIYRFEPNTLRSMLAKLGVKITGFKFINYAALTRRQISQDPRRLRRVYLYCRNLIRNICNLLSPLFKNGNHIRVVCKRGTR